MTTRLWLLLACIGSFGLSGVVQSQEAAAKADEPKTVSIIKLMMRPEAYDKARIRVIGFLALDREFGGGIFLHREDFENENLEHALRFDVRDSELLRKRQSLDRRYVIVEGIFRANEKDSTEWTIGRLTPVTLILAWPFKYNIHGESHK